MSSIAYDKLDNLISSSGLKWEDIVSCYAKDCKTIEVKKGVNLNAENLLYYIRAMSRIVLDYEFQQWNKKYAKQPLSLIAAGSTNITSDYDVTVVGKNASFFVKKVLRKMSNLMQKGKTHLAEFADTNMYILPSVIRPRKNIPKWLTLVPISKDGQMVPLPVSETAKVIEKHYIRELWKKGPLKMPIGKKYEIMIRKVRPLEAFYYGPNVPKMTETEYWHALFTANKYPIEAYMAMSTFLVVVVELQMNRSVSQLQDHHYEIAAVENMIALKEHGLLDSKYSIKKNIKPIKFLKLSKYLQRIQYALSQNKELGNEKDIKNFVSTKEMTDLIVKHRGSTVFADSEPMKAFITQMKTLIPQVIELLKQRLMDQE